MASNDDDGHALEENVPAQSCSYTILTNIRRTLVGITGEVSRGSVPQSFLPKEDSFFILKCHKPICDKR